MLETKEKNYKTNGFDEPKTNEEKVKDATSGDVIITRPRPPTFSFFNVKPDYGSSEVESAVNATPCVDV